MFGLRYSNEEEVQEYIKFRKKLDAEGKSGDGHKTCLICGEGFRGSLVWPTTDGEKHHKYCYCMSSYYRKERR